MLFKWLFGDTSEKQLAAHENLRRLIANAMPESDPDAAAMVCAVAGLLATVAYADRSYSATEQAAVRTALSRVAGLRAETQTAIEALLAQHMVELSHESLQTYTRVLYEGLERPARLEVLEALMELAAADDVLDMSETNLLRRIARGLGLSEEEYAGLQSQHRARLSVLAPT